MRKSLPMCWLKLVVMAILPASVPQARSASPSNYTRLLPVPAPRIITNSVSYPGPYEAGNLLDNDGQWCMATASTISNGSPQSPRR